MNLQSFSVRTDLADELLEGQQKNDLFETEKVNYKGVKTTRVVIHRYDETLKKEPGIYFSIEFQSLQDQDEKSHVGLVLKDNLKQIIAKKNLPPEGKILVVGLGNKNIVADALGPLVGDKIMVTSHVFALDPDAQKKGMKSVSVIAPGVMGQTGIETADIVKSVVREVKPDLVLIIDALATRSLRRINKVIQITDTGINPGSGVHNQRQSISHKSLQVPVIVIGVATVVEVAAIVMETLALVPNDRVTINDGSDVVSQIINENNLNLIVTPKEIDEDMKNLSEVIALSINESLHPMNEM